MPAELALLSLLLTAAPVPAATLPKNAESPPAALIEFLGSPDAELMKTDIPFEPDQSVARPSPTTPKPKAIR